MLYSSFTESLHLINMLFEELCIAINTERLKGVSLGREFRTSLEKVLVVKKNP